MRIEQDFRINTSQLSPSSSIGSGLDSRSRRFERNKNVFPHPRVKVSIVGSLRDREVACSASDRQGSNFESCVWRTVSSQSSHHPQKVLLAQFSLYVHKGGLKPNSFQFIIFIYQVVWYRQTPWYLAYVLLVYDPPPPWPTQTTQASWPECDLPHCRQ